MSRDLVIFDGSNFYHSCKHLSSQTHLTTFDYLGFACFLTKSTQKPTVVYCVGEIRVEKGNEKSLKLYSHQQKLFYHLERQAVIIQKGYMLHTNSAYHEKGVDVRIAIEVLRGAVKNEYDRCFLLSSDTDLIPAIVDARKEKKKIIYVGFKGRISKAMQKNCSSTLEITKEMIKRF